MRVFIAGVADGETGVAVTPAGVVVAHFSLRRDPMYPEHWPDGVIRVDVTCWSSVAIDARERVKAGRRVRVRGKMRWSGDRAPELIATTLQVNEPA
jgi:single-stranded DNA-binding protein